MKTDAKGIYDQIKAQKNHVYIEDIHCPLVIEVMLDDDRGTIAEFCVAAGISDRTFWRWIANHPIFDECYRYGKMISFAQWEKEGRDNHGNPEFNYQYWRSVGWTRFGAGKNSRVRLGVNPGDTPDKHYSQMMKQASDGEFTAGELKQISEVINVGLRTQEVIGMQKEIDEMREDLETMNRNSEHGNYSEPVKNATEENTDTVAD